MYIQRISETLIRDNRDYRLSRRDVVQEENRIEESF